MFEFAIRIIIPNVSHCDSSSCSNPHDSIVWNLLYFCRYGDDDDNDVGNGDGDGDASDGRNVGSSL